MKCPVCGTLNESDSAFCYSCGSDLRGAKEVKPTPRPVICSVCGTANESDALFCSSCGNDLRAKQKKSKLWIVFLVIGLVLVLGGAVAAIFIFGGDKKLGLCLCDFAVN